MRDSGSKLASVCYTFEGTTLATATAKQRSDTSGRVVAAGVVEKERSAPAGRVAAAGRIETKR